MNRTQLTTLGLFFGFAATACATTPPSQQLLSARDAYQQAQQSEAASLEPEHLQRAKVALNKAEEAHDDEPQGVSEKHLSYLAERKAQLAIAKAELTKAQQTKKQAETDYTSLLADQKQTAEVRARVSEEQADEAQRDATQARNTAQKTEAELDRERKARVEAEKELSAARERLDSALNKIADLSKVETKDKEVIITLNGAVLFELGKSELMPSAKEKLSEVAAVLKQEQEGRKIVVEGHTDAQGADQYNMQLSKSRAEAVVQYLVSQGVDRSRIRAVGRGETAPTASNKTPEGRANNRRVEIHLRDE